MRKVTAPDGREWKLGRRWLGKRARLGRAKMRDVSDWASGLDGGADDLGIIGMIILAVFVVIVVVFAALLLFNVVALAIELLIIVILVLGGIVGRVVLRRPWTVFAKSGDEVHTRDVVGWRASGRAIDEMAAELESGRLEAPSGHGR